MYDQGTLYLSPGDAEEWLSRLVRIERLPRGIRVEECAYLPEGKALWIKGAEMQVIELGEVQ
jgi:hypothetical protein